MRDPGPLPLAQLLAGHPVVYDIGGEPVNEYLDGRRYVIEFIHGGLSDVHVALAGVERRIACHGARANREPDGTGRRRETSHTRLQILAKIANDIDAVYVYDDTCVTFEHLLTLERGTIVTRSATIATWASRALAVKLARCAIGAPSRSASDVDCYDSIISRGPPGRGAGESRIDTITLGE